MADKKKPRWQQFRMDSLDTRTVVVILVISLVLLYTLLTDPYHISLACCLGAGVAGLVAFRMASQDEVQSTVRWLDDEQTIHETTPYGENLSTVNDALSAQRHRVRMVADYRKDVDKMAAQPEGREMNVQEAYDALQEVASKRLHCLEDIQQIASIEPVLGNLTNEFAQKATLLVEREAKRAEDQAGQGDGGSGVAKAAQNCILAVRANWCWISKLVRCADTHLQHASDYHQFFHTAAEYQDWMPVDLKQAASRVAAREDMPATKEEANKLLVDLKEVLTLFLHWHGKLNTLYEQSGKIVPVHLRTKKLDYFRPVSALCDYKTKEVTVREGEELTLMDNSDSQTWKVRSINSSEGNVPSVILVIPGPEPTAVSSALRLRLELLGLWTYNVKRIGKSLIWFMILCMHDWSDDELKKLKALPKQEKDEIRRVLAHVEECLLPYWSDYAGFKELQTRITRLRAILDEPGQAADYDPEFSKDLVVKFGLVEELLKRYQDFWSYWDTFRIMVEACKSPEFLLIVEKWQQLQYMEMDELKRRWHTGFGFSSEDQDEFMTWLERWLMTTTTVVEEEVAPTSAAPQAVAADSSSVSTAREQGGRWVGPDTRRVDTEQVVMEVGEQLAQPAPGAGAELTRSDTSGVTGGSSSETVTRVTEVTRVEREVLGEAAPGADVTVTGQRTVTVTGDLAGGPTTDTAAAPAAATVRDESVTYGGGGGGGGDRSVSTVTTTTTTTQQVAAGDDDLLPGGFGLTRADVEAFSQSMQRTVPGEEQLMGGSSTTSQSQQVHTTVSTTERVGFGAGAGGTSVGLSGEGMVLTGTESAEAATGAGSSGYETTTTTVTRTSRGGGPEVDVGAGSSGYSEQVTVTRTERSQVASSGGGGGTDVRRQQLQHAGLQQTQEVTRDEVEGLGQSSSIETATSEQVSHSEQEERQTFVITEEAGETENVIVEEEEETKSFIITEEQCESTGASEVTMGESEETRKYVITGVFDPQSQKDVTMQDAVKMGIINSTTGSYVNKTTGEQMPIPVAMNAGLIKVEYTTTRKTAEKKRDVGLITIKTQRESRPYTVKAVVDAKTERRLTVDEAIKQGVLDQHNGTYYNAQDDVTMSLADAIDSNLLLVEYDQTAEVGEPEIVSKTYAIHSVVDQRAKKTVSFSQAIRKGLLDKETGAYYHNVSGEYTYVGDAIKRGFVKATIVKDPNTLDIDPENKLVVEQLQNIRKKLLNPMKALATLRKAAAAEAAAATPEGSALAIDRIKTTGRSEDSVSCSTMATGSVEVVHTSRTRTVKDALVIGNAVLDNRETATFTIQVNSERGSISSHNNSHTSRSSSSSSSKSTKHGLEHESMRLGTCESGSRQHFENIVYCTVADIRHTSKLTLLVNDNREGKPDGNETHAHSDERRTGARGPFIQGETERSETLLSWEGARPQVVISRHDLARSRVKGVDPDKEGYGSGADSGTGSQELSSPEDGSQPSATDMTGESEAVEGTDSRGKEGDLLAYASGGDGVTVVRTRRSKVFITQSEYTVSTTCEMYDASVTSTKVSTGVDDGKTQSDSEQKVTQSTGTDDRSTSEVCVTQEFVLSEGQSGDQMVREIRNNDDKDSIGLSVTGPVEGEAHTDEQMVTVTTDDSENTPEKVETGENVSGEDTRGSEQKQPEVAQEGSSPECVVGASEGEKLVEGDEAMVPRKPADSDILMTVTSDETAGSDQDTSPDDVGIAMLTDQGFAETVSYESEGEELVEGDEAMVPGKSADSDKPITVTSDKTAGSDQDTSPYDVGIAMSTDQGFAETISYDSEGEELVEGDEAMVPGKPADSDKPITMTSDETAGSDQDTSPDDVGVAMSTDQGFAETVSYDSKGEELVEGDEAMVPGKPADSDKPITMTSDETAGSEQDTSPDDIGIAMSTDQGFVETVSYESPKSEVVSTEGKEKVDNDGVSECRSVDFYEPKTFVTESIVSKVTTVIDKTVVTEVKQPGSEGDDDHDHDVGGDETMDSKDDIHTTDRGESTTTVGVASTTGAWGDPTGTVWGDPSTTRLGDSAAMVWNGSATSAMDESKETEAGDSKTTESGEPTTTVWGDPAIGVWNEPNAYKSGESRIDEKDEFAADDWDDSETTEIDESETPERDECATSARDDSPIGVWNDSMDTNKSADSSRAKKGESSADVWDDSTTPAALDDSQTTERGECTTTEWGESATADWGDSPLGAWGGPPATGWENSATADLGGPIAAPWSDSGTPVWGDSHIHMWGDSTTTETGDSKATERGESETFMWGDSSASGWDDSTAAVWGDSTIGTWDASTISAMDDSRTSEEGSGIRDSLTKRRSSRRADPDSESEGSPPGRDTYLRVKHRGKKVETDILGDDASSTEASFTEDSLEVGDGKVYYTDDEAREVGISSEVISEDRDSQQEELQGSGDTLSSERGESSIGKVPDSGIFKPDSAQRDWSESTPLKKGHREKVQEAGGPGVKGDTSPGREWVEDEEKDDEITPDATKPRSSPSELTSSRVNEPTGVSAQGEPADVIGGGDVQDGAAGTPVAGADPVGGASPPEAESLSGLGSKGSGYSDDMPAEHDDSGIIMSQCDDSLSTTHVEGAAPVTGGTDDFVGGTAERGDSGWHVRRTDCSEGPVVVPTYTGGALDSGAQSAQVSETDSSGQPGSSMVYVLETYYTVPAGHDASPGARGESVVDGGQAYPPVSQTDDLVTVMTAVSGGEDKGADGSGLHSVDDAQVVVNRDMAASGTIEAGDSAMYSVRQGEMEIDDAQGDIPEVDTQQAEPAAGPAGDLNVPGAIGGEKTEKSPEDESLTKDTDEASGISAAKDGGVAQGAEGGAGVWVEGKDTVEGEPSGVGSKTVAPEKESTAVLSPKGKKSQSRKAARKAKGRKRKHGHLDGDATSKGRGSSESLSTVAEAVGGRSEPDGGRGVSPCPGQAVGRGEPVGGQTETDEFSIARGVVEGRADDVGVGDGGKAGREGGRRAVDGREVVFGRKEEAVDTNVESIGAKSIPVGERIETDGGSGADEDVGGASVGDQSEGPGAGSGDLADGGDGVVAGSAETGLDTKEGDDRSTTVLGGGDETGGGDGSEATHGKGRTVWGRSEAWSGGASDQSERSGSRKTSEKATGGRKVRPTAKVTGIITSSTTTTTTTTTLFGDIQHSEKGRSGGKAAKAAISSSTSTTSVSSSSASLLVTDVHPPTHTELSALSETMMSSDASYPVVMRTASSVSGEHARLMNRVCRAAVPVQMLILLLLGMACLVPMADEEFGCMFYGNMLDSSLGLTLHHRGGPPPT